MYTYLGDIIDKLGEPLWWDDSQAIPRYCEFAPWEINNIYAREVALILVECQNCGHEFKIAQNWDIYDSPRSLSDSIKEGYMIGFADPPNIQCCSVGPSETSDKIKVLEFWKENEEFNWERRPEFEVEFGRDPDDFTGFYLKDGKPCEF